MDLLLDTRVGYLPYCIGQTSCFRGKVLQLQTKTKVRYMAFFLIFQILVINLDEKWDEDK